jgi:hypothetical protein
LMPLLHSWHSLLTCAVLDRVGRADLYLLGILGCEMNIRWMISNMEFFCPVGLLL